MILPIFVVVRYENIKACRDYPGMLLRVVNDHIHGLNDLVFSDFWCGNFNTGLTRRLLNFLCLSFIFYSQTDKIVLFHLLHFYTPFLFCKFIHMLFEKESNV